MSKKRTKIASKKKKQVKDSGIRSDIWSLEMSQDQKRFSFFTVAEYRQFLKPLVLIAYWNWKELSSLTTKERVNQLENLVHKTAGNPVPKYSWYFKRAISNHPSFRKFPSYLRRAAIQDALGIVSSFVTRWDIWKRGERKHRYDKPPRLNTMCNSYPALYKGQQIRYNPNYGSLDLKAWNGSDWMWINGVKICKHGKNRHLVEGNEIQSPSLIANKRGVHLSMPVKVGTQQLPQSDYVCSIDIGINTTATISIVGKNGTVKARKSVSPARDIDRRDQAECRRGKLPPSNLLRKQRIATKSKQTRRITGEGLPQDFCKGLYRKSKNINEQIAQTVSKAIVEFASVNGASVIVFEDLSNWKAKAGKRGSLQKQRFHQWCKDRIVELTTQKFSELGGQIVKINAKYTSAYAFDGSGLIKRSNKNYSQATFKNGKRYNADLSASYNIGARYWYAILTNSLITGVWEGKSSSHTQRTPVTLSSLWRLSKQA